MVDKEFKLPFYAKVSIFLIGSVALLVLLYIGKSIIVPVLFSLIIAILLHPVVNFFVGKRMNRVLAIILTLFLTFLIFASFGALMFSQASKFSETWPALVDKFTSMLNQAITWASGYFDIRQRNIHEWIDKTRGEIISSSGAVIGQTLVSIGSVMLELFLVPVYIFIILYYEPLLIEFIRKLSGKRNHDQVREIVTQTKTVIQRYLKGLIVEAIIVATLNSVGLLILGIDYAILLGIIGALLNVIPYIGGIVAVALPMMIAFATKSTAWYALYVLIVYYIIQFIDNHYLIPKIVASKVKINALFSIIVVLVGNAIWGIPGMFLSIPILAIIKLIFDHIEQLKPWGYLLGDTMPSLIKFKPIFKQINTEKISQKA